MTTFYLDFEGGNDANDGTTFANRWKTITSGATAARIAPNDTIRVMASPNETSLGQTATWTQNSKTVTLTTAVTANIDDGEAAWTASANVTSTADATLFKENTKSAKHVIAAGFTTGLASYKATGTLDLSAYQQVSFWIYNTAAITNGSTLSLRLCSDTAGVTTVNTIAIPAIPSVNRWVAFTIDTGGALGSSIKSVALYCDADPGAVSIYLDNIIACKASSSADALTLTSLIGKVWNLCWVASTTYASNDIRKPTQPNRNGYRYKVTAGGGGAAGSSEPTWPQEIGTTVTDGALTWTCEGLEDTWYGIQSIVGTTVLLDNDTNTLASAGRGYDGATEAVTTYKRETTKVSTMGTTSSSSTQAIQDFGTVANPIVFSGGWNRTDMSTQTGELWLDGQNGFGHGFNDNAKANVVLTNLNATRFYYGILRNSTQHLTTNCHANNCANNGNLQNSSAVLSMQGCCFSNNGGFGYDNSSSALVQEVRAISASNNQNSGCNSSGSVFKSREVDFVCRNNASYGRAINGAVPRYISGLITGNNTSGSISSIVDNLVINNCLLPESTEFQAMTAFRDAYLFSQKHDQTANNHLITTDGGTIVSATDQRNTASGISWKFRPTSTNRNAGYPLHMAVARVACSANALVTISIATRRDNTNINGILKVKGGQIAGVNSDVSVACAPSINTWASSGNLTFTPTEAGVVEVTFEVYDGVGTTNNFWIDDFVSSQA